MTIIIAVVSLLAVVAIYFLMRTRARRLGERLREIEDKVRNNKPTIVIKDSETDFEKASVKPEGTKVDSKNVESDEDNHISLEMADEFENAPIERKVEIQQAFLLDVLRRLKTLPEVDEDGDISVAYQGETFRFVCRGTFATVYDPFWLSVPMDSPMLNQVRTAINMANLDSYYTGVITSPDSDRTVFVSSGFHFLLIPILPSPQDYIAMILRDAFAYKNKFQKLLDSLENAPKDMEPLLTSVPGLDSPASN